MSDHQRIRAMMRSPKAMMNFQITGKLPQLPSREKPSPLAQLLLSIAPRDLLQIGPMTVCAELGYRCQNTFRNAQLALNWLYPAHINGASSPADARRDRGFEARNPKLTLEDLAKHATIPDHIRAR